MKFERLPRPALSHMLILNLASSLMIVSDNDLNDIDNKLVYPLKNSMNKHRKVYGKLRDRLIEIQDINKDMLSSIMHSDLIKLKRRHSEIPLSELTESVTNLELLSLYILFLVFQENVDARMSPIFNTLRDIDYMDLILVLSESVGLPDDVNTETYVLAEKIKTVIYR